VRGRFGASELVRVDLSSGDVRAIPIRQGGEDAWPVWSHPRFSPDGRRIAALEHRLGRWRLVTVSSEGGEVADLELPGAPVAQPAWSSDGSRIFVALEDAGIWNLFAVDPRDGAARRLTRVTGGAFSPAPSPDPNGGALFFLEMTAAGVDLRRLDPSSPSPASASPSGRAKTPSPQDAPGRRGTLAAR